MISSAIPTYVGFHPSFSRHGKIEASFILLIWLNENAPIVHGSCFLLFHDEELNIISMPVRLAGKWKCSN